MNNRENSPKQLMPRITKETLDSFTKFGPLETRGGEIYSMFEFIERENPQLFEYISQRASEILKGEPLAGIYIGKGFSQGVAVVYHLLRKQAETNRETDI